MDGCSAASETSPEKDSHMTTAVLPQQPLAARGGVMCDVPASGLQQQH